MQSSLTFWALALGIIVVLLAMVVPRICTSCEKSRLVAAQFDIRGGIKAALDHYKTDAGSFPKNFDDLIQQPSGTTNWHGPYLPQLPLDPWGSKYIYEFPGKHNPSSYDLLSVGPDEKPGTKDDIRNW